MSDEAISSLRKRIIQASRSLLLEEGYRSFSLRKAARKVGISATSIYLHFKNKDDLIHTLIDESIQNLNRELEQASSGVDNPMTRLESVAWAYVDFALEHPAEYKVIYEVSSDEMARYPKEKFRKARKGYEILADTIRQGVKKGVMAEDEPRIASYIFWAELHGVMSVVLTGRLDIRIDRTKFIRQAIEHVIKGFYVRTAVVL